MLCEQTKKTLPTSPSFKKYLNYCTEVIKVHAPVSFHSQRRIHQIAISCEPRRLAPISARYACMECSPSWCYEVSLVWYPRAEIFCTLSGLFDCGGWVGLGGGLKFSDEKFDGGGARGRRCVFVYFLWKQRGLRSAFLTFPQ